MAYKPKHKTDGYNPKHAAPEGTAVHNCATDGHRADNVHAGAGNRICVACGVRY